MVRIAMVVSVLAFLFFFNLNLEGTAWAQERGLRIKYDYKGSFGKYGIADIATAYLDDTKIAEAEAIRIIQKEPGPNQLEVEETHYSKSGAVIYRGRIIFRFGFGGAHPEEETAISGVKRYTIFSNWPAGH